MGKDIRQLTIDYNRAFGERRLDDVTQMLHPDVEFDGPAKPTKGRDAYMSGLPKLVSVLERNEARAGSSACWSTSSTLPARWNVIALRTLSGTSSMSFSLRFGRMTSFRPIRCAASTFCLTPPMGSTRP